MTDGRNIAVDIDLAKFFDTVNHDILMQLLSRDIADKPLLALFGRYLRAGMLVGEHIQPSEVGTPQGGPLSPLLANILLLPNSTASWSGGATALRATPSPDTGRSRPARG